MNVNDLRKLLKGEMIKIKDFDNKIIGGVQIDLECNKFLALDYTGKTPQGKDDFTSMDIWDTLEKAIQQVKDFSTIK